MAYPKMSALALALLLSGCASFSQDGGLQDVSALASARVGQPATLAREADYAQLTQLLSQPLSADSAVQIALLNNRSLKIALAELGASEADLVQAGRLRNPGLSFGRVHGGDGNEIDRSVSFDLAGLLTMPMRVKIEKGRFEQAKLQAASSAVQLAAETRRAYFTAVAAVQTEKFMQQARVSAEAGAELAGRMQQVGNWSRLDQARQQVFYADAVSELARAQHQATVARERLTRLLGLWGTQTSFSLPDRLPDLPAKLPEAGNIEAQAMEQRLDVQMGKIDVHATADALGLSKVTSLVNVLDAGYTNKSVNGAPRENGYEVALELPLFDWGTARNAKAQALYEQSLHRTADTAIRARSEVREAYSGYRTAYDLARHYRDEVVPLRKTISHEVLLRYNGMLASVFELLADAREQVMSVNRAIEAQRDFWIAQTELQAAINGAGSGYANKE
ncbi:MULTISPECIES: TolC family protein [unclassified Janthinobacterium]|uniref:TolC family protein n=1 Tax=unclassified Janthinobacterium TaxID=2610881 RepID=UPI001619C13B|nr:MULTISPECIES: TolC family protein [unclassified Janthinobacterium]MBB5368850.1 outer membrane protein TolC [Janthinobacterium sp. K2C7]MBB5381614.1 outer membrane protein TolC [Janthinobacterium sp. K2Li3]MBB5387232.1 outer membrane protein TolC [Janthinobacterium sp. K2E3]